MGISITAGTTAKRSALESKTSRWIEELEEDEDSNSVGYRGVLSV